MNSEGQWKRSFPSKLERKAPAKNRDSITLSFCPCSQIVSLAPVVATLKTSILDSPIVSTMPGNLRCRNYLAMWAMVHSKFAEQCCIFSGSLRSHLLSGIVCFRHMTFCPTVSIFPAAFSSACCAHTHFQGILGCRRIASALPVRYSGSSCVLYILFVFLRSLSLSGFCI